MIRAFFTDGPRAGEFRILPGPLQIWHFPVYELQQFIDRPEKHPPMPAFRVDEYRHVGTVELYEYTGRHDG
jgi:hypothetical protein